MEGVRILTQDSVLVAAHGGIYSLFAIMVCLVFGLVFWLFFFSFLFDDKKFEFWAFGLALLCTLGCIYYIRDLKKPDEYQTQYLVEVSDDASFNEFYHKYEVIEDKDNNIYLVYEKE